MSPRREDWGRTLPLRVVPRPSSGLRAAAELSVSSSGAVSTQKKTMGGNRPGILLTPLGGKRPSRRLRSVCSSPGVTINSTGADALFARPLGSPLLFDGGSRCWVSSRRLPSAPAVRRGSLSPAVTSAGVGRCFSLFNLSTLEGRRRCHCHLD